MPTPREYIPPLDSDATPDPGSIIKAIGDLEAQRQLEGVQLPESGSLVPNDDTTTRRAQEEAAAAKAIIAGGGMSDTTTEGL